MEPIRAETRCQILEKIEDAREGRWYAQTATSSNWSYFVRAAEKIVTKRFSKNPWQRGKPWVFGKIKNKWEILPKFREKRPFSENIQKTFFFFQNQNTPPPYFQNLNIPSSGLKRTEKGHLRTPSANAKKNWHLFTDCITVSHGFF